MRDARGFTLIELMTVVVIIGFLAAIAIPRFGSTKERAYVATMKEDLRNLVVAQEAYFQDWVTYAATPSALDYSQSRGNMVTITAARGTGWSATVANNATTRTCGIYVGSVVAPISGEAEGAPQCQ